MTDTHLVRRLKWLHRRDEDIPAQGDIKEKADVGGSNCQFDMRKIGEFQYVVHQGKAYA
jgi:hypothetical protein